MKLKFIKEHKILLFVLFFLLSIAIIILTIKSKEIDGLHTVTTEVKKENEGLETKTKTEPKIAVETMKKTQEKQQNPIAKKDLSAISPLLTNTASDKIDFIGKDNLVNKKPSIDQIMVEQKKIDTFAKEKYLIEKKEDWEVDYGVGLEDGAIDSLKTDPSLKPGMVNGKVGFSTSF